jgi:tetratricopeptide (TPR) repeat protein
MSDLSNLPAELCEIAQEYESNKNYDLMKKFYSFSIKKGYSYAMYRLGFYYHKIEKNFAEAVKYYLMGLEKNNFTNPIIYKNIYGFLGDYYYDINQYDLMIKYNLLAIEKKDVGAMLVLGAYYQDTEINYELMKKYFLMAVNEKSDLAMYTLSKHYYTVEKNYEEAIKYYSMGIAISGVGKYESFFDIEDPLIKKHFKSHLVSCNKKDECIICYDEDTEMYYTSCKNHSICFDCSVKLYGSKCPYCRQ